jgi:acyl-coenzyme A thioesterase PaaI-like protein
MKQLPEPKQGSPTTLAALREQAHSWCVMCGYLNPLGLKLEFQPCPDGSVAARFAGGVVFQGYDGMLHGGVIAALLDAAMTNCLFSLGRVAVTAEFTLRYHHPVAAFEPVVVRAHLQRSVLGLHLMHAELVQNDCVKVDATAKFMNKPA